MILKNYLRENKKINRKTQNFYKLVSKKVKEIRNKAKDYSKKNN